MVGAVGGGPRIGASCSRINESCAPGDDESGRASSNIGGRHLVEIMAVPIDDGDEPAAPVPARQSRAVFQIARKLHGIEPSGRGTRQIDALAETSEGKKFVKAKPYTRVVDGKKVRVGGFDRSTPKTSKGKKK